MWCHLNLIWLKGSMTMGLQMNQWSALQTPQPNHIPYFNAKGVSGPTLAAFVEHVQKSPGLSEHLSVFRPEQKLALLEPTQLFHHSRRSRCLHGEVNQWLTMDELHVTLLQAAQLWFPSAVPYIGQGDIFSSLYGYNNTGQSFQWHKMGKARWCGS